MTIRFVPTRVHAALDYATGAALLALPGVLPVESSAAARATRAWGAVGVVSGLTTKHELGLFRIVPMRLHLAADALGGAVLIAAALLVGDRDQRRDWLPAIVSGATGIVLALTTRTRSAGAAG